MIGKGSGLPTIAMTYEHPTLAGVTCVQVGADSRSVTVAYLNMVGVAVDVREFSVQENPELAHIVKFHYFDDVWDMDMVLSIIEPVEADEPACDFTPKWRFVPWQPAEKPDFRNLQSLQVAS